MNKLWIKLKQNIARWVCKQIPQCYKVEVQESEGNIVIYEKDPVGAEGQE
jgi:6-pyruvoyltetrahydropterin/6-carboxytetrahydropterin synthase